MKDVYNTLLDFVDVVPEAYARGWLDQVAGMPLVKFKTYCASGTVGVDVFIAENDFQKSLLVAQYNDAY